MDKSRTTKKKRKGYQERSRADRAGQREEGDRAERRIIGLQGWGRGGKREDQLEELDAYGHENAQRYWIAQVEAGPPWLMLGRTWSLLAEMTLPRRAAGIGRIDGPIRVEQFGRLRHQPHKPVLAVWRCKYTDVYEYTSSWYAFVY